MNYLSVAVITHHDQGNFIEGIVYVGLQFQRDNSLSRCRGKAAGWSRELSAHILSHEQRAERERGLKLNPQSPSVQEAEPGRSLVSLRLARDTDKYPGQSRLHREKTNHTKRNNKTNNLTNHQTSKHICPVAYFLQQGHTS